MTKSNLKNINIKLCPFVGDKATPVFISYQIAFVESSLKIKHVMEARVIPCWMAAVKLVGNVQNAIEEVLRVEWPSLFASPIHSTASPRKNPLYTYVYVVEIGILQNFVFSFYACLY